MLKLLSAHLAEPAFGLTERTEVIENACSTRCSFLEWVSRLVRVKRGNCCHAAGNNSKITQYRSMASVPVVG